MYLCVVVVVRGVDYVMLEAESGIYEQLDGGNGRCVLSGPRSEFVWSLYRLFSWPCTGTCVYPIDQSGQDDDGMVKVAPPQ